MLRALSLSAAGSTALPAWLSSCRGADWTAEREEQLGRRRQGADGQPRFLIVISAAGGASIVDAFLAVRASEAGANAARLNTFPDAQVTSVAGSPFRAVKVSNPRLGAIPVPVSTDQTGFVTRHKDQMLVASVTGTSVNHTIAQKRALTGNGAWKGRTVQECVALQYGSAFPIPNVNMGVSGYAERGTDDTLPEYCYGEVVGSPGLWPLGLDGSKGLALKPGPDALALARQTRRQLDQASVFGQTFGGSRALRRWDEQRHEIQPRLEAADLITRLNILESSAAVPLAQYGLGTSPEAARLRAVFPQYFTDPVEGQAALAFLLLKYRVSCTVTLGPSFNVVVGAQPAGISPPLAFDYSHNDHRHGQAVMWARMLTTIDKLVELLKSEPLDQTSGLSLWDRTLIYVATDFGRTRDRPPNATEFGTGHDLNNGVLLVSPMLKGNRVLGGVDPLTTRTYGFDARTGTPLPMKDESNEPDLFAGVLRVMGVETTGAGLPDASAFV